MLPTDSERMLPATEHLASSEHGSFLCLQVLGQGLTASLPAQGQSQLGANMMRRSPPAAPSLSTPAALPAGQPGWPHGAGGAQGTGAAKLAGAGLGLSAASVAGASQAHSLMMTPEQLKALNQQVSSPAWHVRRLGSFHTAWSFAQVRAAATLDRQVSRPMQCGGCLATPRMMSPQHPALNRDLGAT